MNNKLGITTEEELEEIFDLEDNKAGGMNATIFVHEQAMNISWMLCPTGACTNMGYCV